MTGDQDGRDVGSAAAVPEQKISAGEAPLNVLTSLPPGTDPDHVRRAQEWVDRKIGPEAGVTRLRWLETKLSEVVVRRLVVHDEVDEELVDRLRVIRSRRRALHTAREAAR